MQKKHLLATSSHKDQSTVCKLHECQLFCSSFTNWIVDTYLTQLHISSTWIIKHMNVTHQYLSWHRLPQLTETPKKLDQSPRHIHKKNFIENCYLENRKLCNVITHTKLAKLNVFPLQNPKPLSKQRTHTTYQNRVCFLHSETDLSQGQSLLTCQPSKRLRIHLRYLQFAAAIAKLIFVVLLKKQNFCWGFRCIKW